MWNIALIEDNPELCQRIIITLLSRSHVKCKERLTMMKKVTRYRDVSRPDVNLVKRMMRGGGEGED